MNKSVNTYDTRYDILKFFLSILVVAIHSGLYPSILYPWLRIAVRFSGKKITKFIKNAY